MGKALVLNDESKSRVADFIRENGVMYTLNEVAAILNRNVRSVMRYVETGQLEGNKVGGRWYFTKEQIKDFMKGGKRDGK